MLVCLRHAFVITWAFSITSSIPLRVLTTNKYHNRLIKRFSSLAHSLSLSIKQSLNHLLVGWLILPSSAAFFFHRNE